jgi:hypothetical protein
MFLRIILTFLTAQQTANPVLVNVLRHGNSDPLSKGVRIDLTRKSVKRTDFILTPLTFY